MFKAFDYKKKNNAIRFALRIFIIIFFIFFTVFGVTERFIYHTLLPFVNTDEENLVFLDYKVYGNERLLDKNCKKYISEKKGYLKEYDEFVVVKIKGSSRKIIKIDYIIFYDDSVPELNVEIYVAKNVDFGVNSLPLKTVYAYVCGIADIVVNCLFIFISSVIFLRTLNVVKKEKKKFPVYYNKTV